MKKQPNTDYAMDELGRNNPCMRPSIRLLSDGPIFHTCFSILQAKEFDLCTIKISYSERTMALWKDLGLGGVQEILLPKGLKNLCGILDHPFFSFPCVHVLDIPTKLCTHQPTSWQPALINDEPWHYFVTCVYMRVPIIAEWCWFIMFITIMIISIWVE